MISIDIARVIDKLNAYCRHALEEAASLSISQHSDEVAIGQLLYKLAENPTSDVRLILQQAQIAHTDFRRQLSDSFINSNNTLSGQYPAFSPLLIEALQEAWLLSSLETTAGEIRSGALFLVVLLNPGRYLPLPLINLLDNINREALRKNFAQLLADSGETPDASDAPAQSASASDADTPLARYGTDYTARARAGEIDPVLCRDDDIDLMIDILSRRRKNNPIAVGEAGVGKTALIEGLAQRIVARRVPQHLQQVALWGLDLGTLQAGASVKGEFEKRLQAVIDQVKQAGTPIILFIDEAHTLIGAGNPSGGSDAANLLKPALARGELRTIAATTWTEYKKYIEKDPALTRRFQLIRLDEPSIADSIHILRGLRPLYEKTHGVDITEAAIQAAARLSARYVAGRQLPDKAIDVLDTAAARVTMAQEIPPRELTRLENEHTQNAAEITLLEREQRYGNAIDTDHLDALQQRQAANQAEQEQLHSTWQAARERLGAQLAHRRTQTAEPTTDTAETTLPDQPDDDTFSLPIEVDREHIAAVIADWTGIPITTLTSDRLQRIQQLGKHLNEHILGQVEPIRQIHNHLLTALADLRRPGTPLGAYLLVGPSGVGKTETALQIADYLFGGQSTTINLSEYQEKHSLSRLIGSPPGYVGYGEGGVLSEAIRQRPYAVVLLDEVEKAHPDILNLFYQAFDKGEIADGEGRQIDCQNILFILTANLGFDGTDLADPSAAQLEQQLRHYLKPALLARMQLVRYAYLSAETLHAIVEQRLQRLRYRIQQRYQAELHYTAAVNDTLRDRCEQTANGARQLDAIIDGELLPPLSLALLRQVASGTPPQKITLAHDSSGFHVTFAQDS